MLRLFRSELVVAVALVLGLARPALAESVVSTPEVSAAEQAAFDPADRNLREQSYSRACDAFGAFVKAHPGSALLREAQAKKARACLAASRDYAEALTALRALANDGPLDLGRALANLTLAERGETYVQGGKKDRRTLASEQLEAVARDAGGRWAREARATLLHASFAEMDGNEYDAPRVEKLASRILGLDPSPAERDHAVYGRARTWLQAQTQGKLERAEKELREVGAGTSEWADDALYLLATSRESHGQFTQALELYDAIVARFSPVTSNQRSSAQSRAAEIRRPRLDLSVSYIEVPGTKPRASLGFRNLTDVRLTLRRADPFAQVPRTLFESGEAALAGLPGPVVKTWSQPLKAPAAYAPGALELTLDAVPSGAYVLEAESTGVSSRSQMILATHLASIIKASADRVAVFTADALTGQAVPGADVVLYTHRYDNNSFYDRLACKSDASGVCMFQIPGGKLHNAVAWSGRDGDYTFSRSGATGYAYSKEVLGYVLTDRPLYKPGETVGVKVFVRSREDGPSVPVPDADLIVRTYDPSSRELSRQELKTGPFGTASFEVKLGKDAQLGAYRFHVEGRSLSMNLSPGAFRVEEYKPPEYTVKVEPLGKPRPGEPVKVKISAALYSGGPVAGAQGRAIVTEQGYTHRWARWEDEPELDPSAAGYEEDMGGYRYGNYQPRYGQQTLVFKTGADGTAELEVTAGKGAQAERTYQVQVFITDASRREVSGAGAINVSQAPLFADLRPDRVLYKPGEQIQVRLRAEDANGRPQSPKVELRLLRLGENGATTEILARPAQLQSGRGKLALDADAVGPVRLELRRAGAPATEGALASTDLWLTNDARPLVPPNAGFLLITDRAPLQVGRTVRALVVTPRAGGHVFVALEGEKLYAATALEVKGRARLVELPLTGVMTPNAWLTVGRLEQLSFFSQQAPVRVSGSDTALEVKVAFPKEVVEPGTPISATVTVGGERGTPVELALSVVDEALFAIEPERTDLMSFFGRRPQQHRVATSTTSQHRAFRPRDEPKAAAEPRQPADEDDRLSQREKKEDSGSAKQAMPQSAPAPSAPAGAAMGMDADKVSGSLGGAAAKPSAEREASPKDKQGSEGAAPVKVRTNFSSSAGWFPALKTRSGAAVSAKLALPDSLTRWSTVAIALTEGAWMGVGHGSLRTEKPLMVRLQAPRFFTERDEVTLSAIVSSRLSGPASVEVTFNAPGFKPLDPLTRRVNVPAGGDVRVDARFVVMETGDRKVGVTARAPGAADAMEWTLPVVVHGSAQRASFAGRLGNSFELQLHVPQQRNPAGTRFELTISPSVLSVMLDALPYLAQYPYGCVEQTLSRFVPAAVAAKAVRTLGLPANRIPAELPDMVDAGLKRLYAFQHGDGGWGWWQSDPTNRWMSAYAVYGLSLGRDAGLPVDAGVLERGRSYLTNNLGAALGNPEEHAFMVFALASTGGAPRPALDKAFARRTKLSRRGRSLVALALEAAHDPRARIAVENLDDIFKAAQERREVSAGEANDIWQTSEAIEATAYALMAVSRFDPASPFVAPLTDFLVLRRNGGRWRNTRDTAFAVYALSDLALREAATKSAGSLSVRVNGKAVTQVRYSRGGMDLTAPLVLPDSAFRAGENTVTVTRDGGGTGYYAATFDVYNQDENVKAVGGDVKVSRTYTLLGKPSAVAERVAAPTEYGMPVESGVRVRVDLEVKANKAVEFLMIEDLKPAGLEAVMLRSGPEVCSYACAHAELRTDRVAMFLTQIPVGVTKLSYELRAEVPGHFHALPARVEAMYAPEIRATSDEMRLEVRDVREPGGGVATGDHQ